MAREAPEDRPATYSPLTEEALSRGDDDDGDGDAALLGAAPSERTSPTVCGAFWLLGLFNNSSYVIMIASAKPPPRQMLKHGTRVWTRTVTGRCCQSSQKQRLDDACLGPSRLGAWPSSLLQQSFP
ncbi:hypothetical protein M885DRAFT_485427, partial [Pelagophyceae sp. CCMP2097]